MTFARENLETIANNEKPFAKSRRRRLWPKKSALSIRRQPVKGQGCHAIYQSKAMRLKFGRERRARKMSDDNVKVQEENDVASKVSRCRDRQLRALLPDESAAKGVPGGGGSPCFSEGTGEHARE